MLLLCFFPRESKYLTLYLNSLTPWNWIQKHQGDILRLSPCDRWQRCGGTLGWHWVSGTCRRNARWGQIATAATCPAKAERGSVLLELLELLEVGREDAEVGRNACGDQLHRRRGGSSLLPADAGTGKPAPFAFGGFGIYLCFTLQNKMGSWTTQALFSSGWGLTWTLRVFSSLGSRGG